MKVFHVATNREKTFNFTLFPLAYDLNSEEKKQVPSGRNLHGSRFKCKTGLFYTLSLLRPKWSLMARFRFALRYVAITMRVVNGQLMEWLHCSVENVTDQLLSANIFQ